MTWNKSGTRLHASWDNTTLGTIAVDRDSLTATVNSRWRATRLRRLVETRLADYVLFLRAVEESADALLAQARLGACARR